MQFLILKKYIERRQINSYEFYARFEQEFPEYPSQKIKDQVAYLHSSGFLESPAGTFNTLGISTLGEEKYRIENAAIGRRRLFGGDGFQDDRPVPLRKDLPAENPKTQPSIPQKKMTARTIALSCWEVINKNLIISGLIVLIVGTLILKYFHVI